MKPCLNEAARKAASCLNEAARKAASCLNEAARKAASCPKKKAARKAASCPNEAARKAASCPKKKAARKAARKAVLETDRKAASKASREASRKAKRSALLEAAHYKKEHEFLFYHVMNDLSYWGEIDIAEKRKKFYLPHYQSFQVKVLKGLEDKTVEFLGKDISKFLFSFLSPIWKQNIDLHIPSQLTCRCVCVKKNLTRQFFLYWSHFHQLRCFGDCDCRFSNSSCSCNATPECNCSVRNWDDPFYDPWNYPLERCLCFDDINSDKHKNRVSRERIHRDELSEDEFNY
jgi:hypothetical protein